MWSLVVFADQIQQYAAVMGMPMQLYFGDNNLSNAASALFIVYLIAEVPMMRDNSSIAGGWSEEIAEWVGLLWSYNYRAAFILRLLQSGSEST